MARSSIRTASSLFVFAAIGSLAAVQAQAANCPSGTEAALTIGTVAGVAAGGARSYSLSLASGEGVIIDLASLKPKPAAAESSEDSTATAAATRALRLCDSSGTLLTPQPGEVFEKGGSVRATDDGERLHFMAAKAGQYIVSVTASDEPREILARRRSGGTSPAPVVSARLGWTQKGITSSKSPMVFSFDGKAGEWVMLKSTSEKDTVLRLAGPDKAGDYAQMAENDDSDGLNPVIRRKLPLTGTYYLQVDSLSEEPAEFELALNRTDAPKPPPPPSALNAGDTQTGRLADGDAIKLYAIPVVAGHSYRIDLTAGYDGAVGIGLPNPVEPDDGNEKPDAAFSEVKSQDSSNGAGTEKLTFTARSSGQLLVRVRNFGIGETDGSFTISATDLGG